MSKRKVWGAFQGDTLCCRGTRAEMENKVANEIRRIGNGCTGGWVARRLANGLSDGKGDR